MDFEMNLDTETENNINIIEDNDNIIIENNKNKSEYQDRYITLLETLGLNVNIEYPIKFIFQIIIELHTIKISSVNIN
jgi:hypothetical protein